MKLHAMTASLTLLATTSIALAGASSQRPTTGPAPAQQPVSKIELSPVGCLHVYNDAMQKGDKSDLLTRTYAATDDGLRLRDMSAEHDAVVGSILKHATSAIDEKSAREIGRALGDIGNADLESAEVTIEGDHARVNVAGRGDTPMVLVDGVWKLDYDKVAADINQQQPGLLDRELAMKDRINTAAVALDKAIVAGNVKSVDEAVRLLRINLTRQLQLQP